MLISKPALTTGACAGVAAAAALAVLRSPSSAVGAQATIATDEPRAAIVAAPPAPPPMAPRSTTFEGQARVFTADGHAVDVVADKALGRVASPPRLITVLHAMCISPQENCAFLRPLAEGRGMLVCPTGNATCGDGSSTWEGPAAARAEYVRDSIAAAERFLGQEIDHARGDVLFGSSRGAFVARDVIYEGPSGRWTGLVLVGAEIALDPARVRRAGVRRVLLAAPDFDGAAATMRRSRGALCRAGIPARFVSLGPHGHGMIEGSPAILARSLDWVMGSGDTPACAEPTQR
jgi:hypothetical protein